MEKGTRSAKKLLIRPHKIKKIVEEKIQSGVCFVNDYVKSDPRLPFGGVKMSGYGRELSGYGLMEFVNIKSIVVENNN